jgi:hypothetical protein
MAISIARMVALAVSLLDPAPDDRVLDLFCGLGNFTLPLARRAGRVIGIDSDPQLIDGARANAEPERHRQCRSFGVSTCSTNSRRTSCITRLRLPAARPPAQRRNRGPEAPARTRPAPHRLCLLQSGDARARRRIPGQCRRLPRWRRPASWTCSRTPATSSRSPSSTGFPVQLPFRIPGICWLLNSSKTGPVTGADGR